MVLCLCVWPSDGRSQLDFCPSVLYVLSVKPSVFRETKTEHNVVPQGEAVWFVAFLPTVTYLLPPPPLQGVPELAVLMPSPNLTVTSKSHSLLMSGIIYLHFYGSCCHLLVLLYNLFMGFCKKIAHLTRYVCSPLLGQEPSVGNPHLEVLNRRKFDFGEDPVC